MSKLCHTLCQKIVILCAKKKSYIVSILGHTLVSCRGVHPARFGAYFCPGGVCTFRSQAGVTPLGLGFLVDLVQHLVQAPFVRVLKLYTSVPNVCWQGFIFLEEEIEVEEKMGEKRGRRKERRKEKEEEEREGKKEKKEEERKGKEKALQIPSPAL